MKGGEAVFVVRLFACEGRSFSGRRGDVAKEPPSLDDYAGDLRRSDVIHCGGDVDVRMTSARRYIHGRVNGSGMCDGGGALNELMYRRTADSWNNHLGAFAHTGCTVNIVMFSLECVPT